jgi:hypothetical protein
MATTIYSDRYVSSTDGTPKNLKVPVTGMGLIDQGQVDIPTTQIDGAADFTAMVPVRNGRDIYGLIPVNTDMDSGTALDLDIILRDPAGVIADVILYNAGAAFQAAMTGLYIPVASSLRLVNGYSKGYADVGYYVNTAAGTPVAATAATLTVIGH